MWILTYPARFSCLLHTTLYFDTNNITSFMSRSKRETEHEVRSIYDNIMVIGFCHLCDAMWSFVFNSKKRTFIGTHSIIFFRFCSSSCSKKFSLVYSITLSVGFNK